MCGVVVVVVFVCGVVVVVVFVCDVVVVVVVGSVPTEQTPLGVNLV